MLDEQARRAIPSTDDIGWPVVVGDRLWSEIRPNVHNLRALDSTSNDDQFILLSEAPTCVRP